jgi:uncharacterized protein
MSGSLPPISPMTEPLPELEERSAVERHGINPMLFAFGALASIFVLYQFVGGVITFFIAGSSVTASNVTLIRVLTLFGQIVLILVPVLGFARLLSVHQEEIFPFRRPSWLEATYALVGLFALQRVLEVYETLQDQIPLPEVLRQVLAPLREMFEALVKTLAGASSFPELLAVVFIVAAVPAVVEELMFRGLIQRAFEKVMSPVVAAVFAGTIFGLFHLNPFDLVPLIVLGVYFGILRHRSHTLLLPMAAHFLNNLLAVLAFYLGMDQESAAVGLQVSPGALLVRFLFFGALFTATFLGYLRTTEEWRMRIWRGEE